MSQWSIVDAPGIGDEGTDAIVQVGGCGGGIARVSYGAYLRVATHEGEGLGADLVEVGIVVESPLGAEHDDKLASLTILSVRSTMPMVAELTRVPRRANTSMPLCTMEVPHPSYQKVS